MYVYVSSDSPSTALAVFPRPRGRTHAKHFEIEPDVFVGIVDAATVATATGAEQFKLATIDPKNYLDSKAMLEAGDPVGGKMILDVRAAVATALINSAIYSFKCPNIEIMLPADKLAPVARTIKKRAEYVRKTAELLTSTSGGDDVEEAFAMYKMVAKVSAMLLRHRGGWIAATADAAEPEAVEETGFGFDKMARKPELKLVGEAEGTADEESGVFWPKPDKTYILQDNVDRLFKTIQAASEKAPQNVRLVGPHGCGKTEMAIQFAARYNRPLLIMDCANLREARDWFGYKSAKEGTVFWHESQFVKAVEAGNHVILLDELNRATPHVLNTLLPLLDARRFTYLEERGAVIKVGPNTVFCASMNEGAGYTGTSALDMALGDRFPRVVELTYLPEADEAGLLMRRTGLNSDIATRLVQTANKVRADATGINATMSKAISTRQLLAAAHDFVLGGVDTLTFTIINHFSPDGDNDSERAKVTAIIQGKFGDVMEEAKVKRGA